MKILFKSWSWLNGRSVRIVNIEKTLDGYWRKRSQRALIAALKEMKGVEVED